MSHSKRNTSLAFFTSFERSQLKAHWGSQATRLTRDSFIPFASCRLCLQIARDPVACATNGDLFCRECAVSNLLAQKKEIKRFEKEDERRRKEEEDLEHEKGEEERGRAVQDFERVMMGLEGSSKKPTGGAVEATSVARGVKRKFELDEEEMLKNAKEERAKARKALDEEKATKPALPSFWVPSLTPQSSTGVRPSKALKLRAICPASSETSPHGLSLKTLISVSFATSSSSSHSTSAAAPSLICPACKKGLSNGLKAMLTVPCGHVICKACVNKFMKPNERSADPHAIHNGETEDLAIRCYVCEEDLTDKVPRRKDRLSKESNGHSKEDKERVKPGLIEISAEGTGFAGGGKNMARREGVAFQC